MREPCDLARSKVTYSFSDLEKIIVNTMTGGGNYSFSYSLSFPTN